MAPLAFAQTCNYFKTCWHRDDLSSKTLNMSCPCRHVSFLLQLLRVLYFLHRCIYLFALIKQHCYKRINFNKRKRYTMTITTIMKSGILKSNPFKELYDQLMRINYIARANVQYQKFNIGENYIFEGTNGKLIVMFDESDLN